MVDIIVCVKHVPLTSDVELKIGADGRKIEKAGLVFDINEWDEYAVEEAVRIKEKLGGTVTVMTVGDEYSDHTLRKCLARGADKAIRLTDPKFEGSDGYAIAKILYNAIKNLRFDLILTGFQAEDDAYSMVGPILAEMLGVPHVTLVKKIELDARTARVNRELEGGLEEVVEVRLPALFAVQTGINVPRYVSMLSIRKVLQKEIKVMNLAEIGLKEDEVGEAGSWLKIEKLYLPPLEKQIKFLEGNPEEVAAQLVEVLKSKGFL